MNPVPSIATSTNPYGSRNDLSYQERLGQDVIILESGMNREVPQGADRFGLADEKELRRHAHASFKWDLGSSTAFDGILHQLPELEGDVGSVTDIGLDETLVGSKTYRFIQFACSHGDTSVHQSLRNIFLLDTSGTALESIPPIVVDSIERVANVVVPQDLVEILRSANRDDVAEQLEELLEYIDEDLSEPEIVLDSLKGMVLFLIEESQFESPVIGLDPVGNVQAEWSVFDDGLLVMNFRPNGLIRFVAISAPARPGIVRMRDKGTLPKSLVLQRIQPFLS